MRRILLPILASATLLSGSAVAQTGTLDQDNSTPTNIVVWMEFAPFLYQQVVEVGAGGTLEGFMLRIAPSSSSTPTLPVTIFEWNNVLNTPGAQLWTGGASSTNANMTNVFTDVSSAGINLQAGDFILIEVGDPNLTANGWNLTLNSGWDSNTNTPFAQYPHTLYKEFSPHPIHRLVFQTWMLSGSGTNYCGPAVANSTGNSAVISALGSPVVAMNLLTLNASDLPQNQFGYFLNSMTQGFVQNPGNSQGNLCLGGQIGRYNAFVASTGTAGSLSLALDLTQTPTPAGNVSILAGETWNFTCWFRDNNPGSTSNFTDAISVDFL